MLCSTPGASFMMKGRTNAYVPYKDANNPAILNVFPAFGILEVINPPIVASVVPAIIPK